MQFVPETPSPQVRKGEPADRDYSVPATTQTPHHPRRIQYAPTVHPLATLSSVKRKERQCSLTHSSQWARKSHLRTQPRTQPDPSEGGATTELVGVEAAESDETCVIHERKCERYILAVPRKWVCYIDWERWGICIITLYFWFLRRGGSECDWMSIRVL